MKHEILTIGFVGRIQKEKGVINLIESINFLKKNNFKIELCIWGELDDPKRHGFNRDEINFLNLNREYFKGVSSDKDLIYSSFDVFCLPSKGEGLSKSAIEAASYGKPLLLSRVPGNNDMIKNNGFYFDYNNTQSLNEKLIDFLDLSLNSINEMSKNSFNLFNDRWHMEKIAEMWKKILKRF